MQSYFYYFFISFVQQKYELHIVRQHNRISIVSPTSPTTLTQHPQPINSNTDSTTKSNNEKHIGCVVSTGQGVCGVARILKARWLNTDMVGRCGWCDATPIWLSEMVLDLISAQKVL